jgi:hypothetical protein
MTTAEQFRKAAEGKTVVHTWSLIGLVVKELHVDPGTQVDVEGEAARLEGAFSFPVDYDGPMLPVEAAALANNLDRISSPLRHLYAEDRQAVNGYPDRQPD